jgi:hypothetical protein
MTVPIATSPGRWGSAQAAVGKQIRSIPTDPWSEVIGVVGDIRGRTALTGAHLPLCIGR